LALASRLPLIAEDHLEAAGPFKTDAETTYAGEKLHDAQRASGAAGSWFRHAAAKIGSAIGTIKGHLDEWAHAEARSRGEDAH
jgi:hypothetical protein